MRVPLNDQSELERAINEKIEIRDYDPAWSLRFQAERDRLQAICGDTLIAIEHIGSTAVPGLPAKPIIDILAAVSSMDAADELVILLCANGYTTSAEFNATLGERRWLMRQEGGRRTHHLHLVLHPSDEWSNKLRFRDMLRQNRELCQGYLALKRRLAVELGGDRESYTEAKSDFIRAALASG